VTNRSTVARDQGVRVVRILVELSRDASGAVEGSVISEGSDEAEPFSGWLELLRLLENAAGRHDDPKKG
jgi:hypothetical protein